MSFATCRNTEMPRPKSDIHGRNETSTFDIRSALSDQRELSLIESISLSHERSIDRCGPSTQRYRTLIPLTSPKENEQYAFEVDLDACSGCKACVSACHHLNGLEFDETWRSVGLLVGDSDESPLLQHVTTACHHCVDPACLTGCPTNAYVKDATSGIVFHLDDQCFGCQYCILTCPYEVPRYSASKGIVRKCDMCRTRLATSEAPACVQACPNEAIRISTVSRNQVSDRANDNRFLPGAASPQITQPTTIYRGRVADAVNASRVDNVNWSPQHVPWSLVIMLVLTQMSVGMQTFAFLFDSLSTLSAPTATWLSLGALVTGMIGVAAATFHLGRPHLAYRVVLGWNHSWLSREAIAFAAYIGASVLHIYCRLQSHSATWALVLTLATGWIGLLASIRIYQVTRRAFWAGTITTLRFVGTAVLLGGPSCWFLSFVRVTYFRDATATLSDQQDHGLGAGLLCCLCLLAAKWMFERRAVFAEAGQILSVTAQQQMIRHVRRSELYRTLAALLGVTAVALAVATQSQSDDFPKVTVVVALTGVASLLLGEIIERATFFAFASTPRMPGGWRP